jgi:4-hydroxy-tetrahydrodipicolinate synthase
MQVNIIEANPIPVKWAMSVMGLLEPVYRLPMVEPSAENKQKIGQALESAGLLAAAGAH